MLETLLSGSVFGVVGSIITNIADHFKQKQLNAHNLEMKRLDIQVKEKEWTFLQKRTEVEANKEMYVADTRADSEKEQSTDRLVETSYKHDSRQYSTGVETGKVSGFFLILVDFIRGVVRPGLTVYLIWLVHNTRTEVKEFLDAAGIQVLDASQALGIYGNVVEMIMFLASAALGWWFCTRKKAN